MARRQRAALLAGTLAVASVAFAGDFRLDGPELLEAPKRASNLVAADLDGDRRVDLAVVSNDEAILRIWHATDSEAQSASSWRREQYTLDRLVTDMAAADADGDGRVDLILAGGSNVPLLVMRQGEEGRLQKGREIPLRAERIVLGDLVGDGREDLLALRGRRFDILRADDRGFGSEPDSTLFATTPPPTRPLILDLNGDGANDIVHTSAEMRDRVFARMRSPEGEYSAELALRTGAVRDLAPLARGKGPGALAMIHGATREVVVMALSEPVDGASKREFRPSEPRVVGFDPDRRDESVVATVADVDGDERLDIVCALPGSATMRVLRAAPSGNVVPGETATLKGIRQAIAWPVRKGTAAPILVLSGEEKALGVSLAAGEGTLEFPRPLALKGTPLAAAVAAGKKKGAYDLLVAEETADARRLLRRYRDFDPRKPNLQDSVEAFDFVGGKEPPRSIEALDADRDGLEDLVVFYEFARPAVLIQRADGTFVESGQGGMIEGMLKGVPPRAIGSVRLDGQDGDDALLVREEYVRAFHLGADGQVVVSRQFLGTAGRARLRLAASGRLRTADRVDVVVFDAATRTVAVHGRDEDGSEYRELAVVELDGADYQALRCLDLDGDGRDDIVAVAPDRVSIVYARPLEGALDTVSTFKTAVDEGGFGGIRALALRGKSASDLVAVEMKENRLEFLSHEESEAGETLAPFYHFRVFDSESSLARRVNLDAMPEPRELVAADVNGDGANDLVALANDYVIVYRRK